MSGGSEQAREFIERVVSECEEFLVAAEDGTVVGVVDKILFDDAGRVAQTTRAVAGLAGGGGRSPLQMSLLSPSVSRLVVSIASVARGVNVGW